MGRSIRDFDWLRHPLGPVERWPESLRSVINLILSSREPMWVGWGAELTFFCNGACQLLLRANAEKVVGVPASEVWADAWSDLGPFVETARASGHSVESPAIRSKSGLEGSPWETVCAFSCSPVMDNDDGAIRGVWCIVKPVTRSGERMHSESRFRERFLATESDAQVSRLIELMPAAIYTCDAQGRITCFNRRAADLWGREPKIGDEDRRFCGSLRLWLPDGSHLPHEKTPMAVAIRDGRSFRNHDVIIEQPSGGRVTVNVNIDPIKDDAGHCIGAINVFVDVTDTRRVEQHLRDSQIATQRLAAIVQYSGDAIVSKTLDGVITTWNGGAERLFGYTAAEMIGQSVLRLIPPDRHEEEAMILDQLRRDEVIEHYETIRIHKDGTRLDLSLSVSPLKDSSGTVVGASKIAHDITERKRTEAELARREQLYRAVGESIDYGIWVCDAAGNNTYASESFLKLVGLTQEECSEFGWSRVLHPDEAGETIQSWKECATSGTVWEREHRVLGVDGDWHPILARGVPVRDDSGRILNWVGINLDISHLKENEAKLHRQARDLEALNRVGRTLAAERNVELMVQTVTDAGREVSRAAFGAFCCDVDHNNGNTFQLYSLSGGSREDFAGFDLPRYTPLFGPAFPGGEAVRIPDVLSDSRWGTIPPHRGMPTGNLPVRSYLAVSVVSHTGKIHGGLIFGHPEPDVFTKEAEEMVVAIARQAAIAIDNANLYRDMQRELLEHGRAEQALRESEERFRTLADNISVFAWTADPKGWIFWYNHRWFEYTGTTLPEMEGWGWRKVHHPDHVDRVVEKFSRHVANGEIWEDTFPLRSHDGEYRWFLSRAMPIRDANGEVVRWFGTNTDITLQREAEIALERARDEAVAASRAKDDFLAALSHELRTPLNPVLLLASDAAEDPGLSDQVRADFEIIRRNVSLEARLIDDLLDLTLISRGKLLLDLGEHDVHAILRDALGTVHADAEEKGVSIALDLKAVAVRVRGDAVRLQQVFWNVLKNAVKFTSEGGRIAVKTRTDEQTKQIEIVITDSGIGLRPEEISRIFDAFAQGDHASTSDVHRFGGLGLGLTISRTVVAMHGGTIGATSDGLGTGATFMISLPLISRTTSEVKTEASIKPAAVPQAENGTDHRRLLLVEDHGPTRTALERLLKRRKFLVTSAGSLAEARACLSGEKFALIVSDLGLPDGSGCDLMRECSRDLGIKGIALSGYGMEQDIARSRAAGFSAHLIKPINVQLLDTAIAEALRTEEPGT